MATVWIQVEYKNNNGAHWFYGRDRLSTGVLVGNKDWDAALAETKRQLKESLESVDVRGTPKCTLDDATLKAHADQLGHCMTVWSVDSFS